MFLLDVEKVAWALHFEQSCYGNLTDRVKALQGLRRLAGKHQVTGLQRRGFSTSDSQPRTLCISSSSSPSSAATAKPPVYTCVVLERRECVLWTGFHRDVEMGP